MKKYIHISSLVPSQILINGEKISSLHPDIVATHDFYISFLPTSPKYLPCTISTRTNICPSGITKIPFKGNHFDIIYDSQVSLEYRPASPQIQKQYNGTMFSITNSDQSFISISAKNFNYFSTTEPIKMADFKTHDSVVTIVGNISDDKKYLLIYDTKTRKIVIENTFRQVEIGKEKIKALKPTDSLSDYGIVYTFTFSTKKLDKYNIYLSDTPPTHSDELTPMLFLESIKYGDFGRAKTYLFNSATTPQLEQFFGRIDKIYFNRYSDEPNYTTLSDGNYKNYTFLIADGKISEIKENPL